VVNPGRVSSRRAGVNDVNSPEGSAMDPVSRISRPVPAPALGARSSKKRSFAVRGPGEPVGVNVIVMEHDADEAMVLPEHVLAVMENCDASVPVIDAAPKASVAGPLLVKVKICGELVLPGNTLPKATVLSLVTVRYGD